MITIKTMAMKSADAFLHYIKDISPWEMDEPISDDPLIVQCVQLIHRIPIAETLDHSYIKEVFGESIIINQIPIRRRWKLSILTLNIFSGRYPNLFTNSVVNKDEGDLTDLIVRLAAACAQTMLRNEVLSARYGGNLIVSETGALCMDPVYKCLPICTYRFLPAVVTDDADTLVSHLVGDKYKGGTIVEMVDSIRRTMDDWCTSRTMIEPTCVGRFTIWDGHAVGVMTNQFAKLDHEMGPCHRAPDDHSTFITSRTTMYKTKDMLNDEKEVKVALTQVNDIIDELIGVAANNITSISSIANIAADDFGIMTLRDKFVLQMLKFLHVQKILSLYYGLTMLLTSNADGMVTGLSLYDIRGLVTDKPSNIPGLYLKVTK